MYNVHVLVYDILCFVPAAQRGLSLKQDVHLIIAVMPFKQYALVKHVMI